MKIKIILLTILLFLVCTSFASGQGCSDAGVCTLDGFKPEADLEDIKQMNRIRFGLTNGLADYDIGIWSSFFEYGRILSSQLSISVKLGFISQSVDYASSSGLSDLFISGKYKAIENGYFTLGLKIPLADGNKMADGRSLPLDFQPSLGSYDLIAGFSYQINNFSLAIAWQQPLSQNDNEFLVSNYPKDSEFNQFQSTNQYKRQGDIMIRCSYALKLAEKWRISPGLLAVYHLSNDEYEDENQATQIIEGSQGLTLNGTLYCYFLPNPNSQFVLSFGAPIISRDTRPDGLTRAYVITIEYQLRF